MFCIVWWLVWGGSTGSTCTWRLTAKKKQHPFLCCLLKWEVPDIPEIRIQTLPSVIRKSMIWATSILLCNSLSFFNQFFCAHLCPAREPKTFSGKRLDSFYRHKCFQSEEQHTYLKPNILETATIHLLCLVSIWRNVMVFPIDYWYVVKPMISDKCR